MENQHKTSFNYHRLPDSIEPGFEKTGLRGFQSDPTQTRLYSDRRLLEAGNFVFRK